MYSDNSKSPTTLAYPQPHKCWLSCKFIQSAFLVIVIKAKVDFYECKTYWGNFSEFDVFVEYSNELYSCTKKKKDRGSQKFYNKLINYWGKS